MSKVKKQKNYTHDVISSRINRNENPVTLQLLLKTISSASPISLIKGRCWRHGKMGITEVRVFVQVKEGQDFPARRSQRHPRVPQFCQPHSRAHFLPCPDGAKASVMTSRSAKSKHSLCFFHGQILTPNCQHWPPNSPNGKLPFPRK